MMAYHFNVVSHLIFGIAGVLLGYYFANESWRNNRMWEWKSITQQLRLQETEIHRLETINESLVSQLKELK
jgi:hypothetical protein